MKMLIFPLAIGFLTVHISSATLRDGAYTIQSQEDGNYLNADSPGVTTGPKNGLRGQRWKLESLGSNKYAIINEMTNNEVSKADFGEEGYPEWTRFTLVPVASGRDVYLLQKGLFIRSARGPGRLQNACLLKQGDSSIAFFARCETHSKNQQWRFIKV